MQETQETQIWSLCQEDLLEEEMATHSSILVGNSKDTETWKSTVREVAKSRTQLSTHSHRVEKPVNNSSKKQLKMFRVPLWDGLRGGCEWTAVLFSGIFFHQVHICTTLIFLSFYFIVESSRLTMWWFQVHSRATQPYIHMYPFSHKRPSHPACRIALSRVPCAIQ